MKLKTLILPILFASILSSGCENESSTNVNTIDSTAVDSSDAPRSLEIPADPLVFEDGEFGMRGMDYFAVGDTIAHLLFDMEGVTVKDTLFKDMALDDNDQPVEIAWEVKKVMFENGPVYLESDFDQGKTVNRIRVQTPRYRHFFTNVGVGSTVKEVAEAYPGLAIRPFKAFDVIELIPNNQNIFHIPYQELADPEDFEAWDIDLLPQDTQVFQVVIM